MPDDYSLKNETRPVLDMYTVPEDDRIKMIGECARARSVGVLLETDAIAGQKGKIARYIKKVTARFPDVRHVSTKRIAEVPNCAMVTFGPKPQA